MSSVIRHIAQIPVRTEFFLVLQDASAGLSVSVSSAFTLDNPWPTPIGTNVVSASDLDDNATPVALTRGALYRDLGRQVVLSDPDTGAHLAQYRAALLVNGDDSEGVGAFTEVFLRVWASDGTGVKVARTG
jgi:hypothetical protein